MKSKILQVTRRTRRNWTNIRSIMEWQRNGKVGPTPHLIKQRLVKRYAREYGLSTFVETGTYKGAMVEAVMNDFDRIYSIELEPTLYTNAARKFMTAEHVTILEGDSGMVLGEIMPLIDSPALFWLDGHYSEGVTARGELDTPILDELEHVLAGNDDHVILIDDARYFLEAESGDYPTLAQLEMFIGSQPIGMNLSIENDVICLVPGRG